MSPEEQASPAQNLQEIDHLIEIRYRVYKSMSKLIHERHEHHLCPPNILKCINDILMICQDHIQLPICIWEYSQTYIGNHTNYVCCLHISKVPCIGWPFRRYLHGKLTFEYGVVSNLIAICKEVIHNLAERDETKKDYKRIAKMTHKEISDDLIACEEFLGMMESNFKGLIEVIHTKYAAFSIVNTQIETVKKLNKQGYILDEEYEAMLCQYQHRITKLHQYNPQYKFNLKSGLMLDFPILAVLKIDDLEVIGDEFENCKQTYPKDAIIMEKGDTVHHVLFILKGLVSEEFE
jgi:hypothetical protein